MFSDGIPEAGGGMPKDQFGEDRIAACLRECRYGSAEDVGDGVLNKCREFNRGPSFDDDCTLIVLRRR